MPHPALSYEAEVLPGLEPFARTELAALRGVGAPQAGAGRVTFSFGGSFGGNSGDSLEVLAGLRTATAVYRVLAFAVPRPKALLGHEHLARLLSAIAEVRRHAPFSSFRLSAAGGDSAVFERLRGALAQHTGLTHEPQTGELLLRVRRTASGWEVLVRLTPRPLSARAWRVCNRAGGLNAAVAAAMLALAELRPGERFFNPMCGSGTLLLEAALAQRPARVVGCDTSAEALECAARNAAAAGVEPELLRADATALPLPDASFGVIAADPPWGDAVGDHRSNEALYPALLAECARVAAPRARLVLLSHELKLLERVLRRQALWRPQRSVQVFHGGHYPRAYLLTRVC